MYLRVCSIAGDPAGRGPMATICRRCSHARLESNFWDCAVAENAETKINTEITVITEKTFNGFLRDLCDLCVENRLMISYLSERNRASPGPCRSAAGARSSALNREASPPIAPPSPRRAESRTA